MRSSSIIITLSLLSVIAQSLPDCTCITGFEYEEIDCTGAVNDGTIELLQTFLELDCMDDCASNFQCQQTLSLLTQFYDRCPLGTVPEKVIRSFWDSTTCSDCIMVPKYNNSTLNECGVINDCDMEKATIQDNIDYLSVNCINDSSDSCDDDCADNWRNVSSYLRRCRTSLDTESNIQVDELYMAMSTCTTKDCNIVELFGHDGYEYDCDASFNSNYSDAVSMYGKLDLTDIQQQTMLCFYGLNITDPTIYDLICIERTQLNSTGILSYTEVSGGTNAGYWGAFGIGYDMDQVWVLLCGALVFFMQTGFTLLEAGTVKSGNVQNILFKNMMDACIGAIIFYMIGYCVAYGDESSPDANGFIGVEAILIELGDYNSWFFQWAFAATAATIVSGAVAERCSIEGYFIYTVCISAWIYPVVVHWVWSGVGWISAFNSDPSVYAGAIDFAGSAVVHMVGGFCGLCGAFFLGPRFRRFDKSQSATSSKYYLELMHQFEFGHNVPFQVLGTLILWFGWYGFNAGSTLAANGAMELASKVAVTTTLAAGSGGITCAVLARVFQKSWHIPRVCNGILAALVSITASCAVVSPGASIPIGIIGGLVYYGASNLVEKFEIDDPLDAFAVHGAGGAWGVLSAGIFGTDKNVEFAGYDAALYADTTHGERFATQLTLVVVVACWTLLNGGLLFGIMSRLRILRISEAMERSGIDIKEHGGKAVNMNKTYTQSLSQEDFAQAKFDDDDDDDDEEKDDGDGAESGRAQQDKDYED